MRVTGSYSKPPGGRWNDSRGVSLAIDIETGKRKVRSGICKLSNFSLNKEGKNWRGLYVESLTHFRIHTSVVWARSKPLSIARGHVGDLTLEV